MELTKTFSRLLYYKIMLERLKYRISNKLSLMGFCFLIPFGHKIENLPELMEYKPEEQFDVAYWFDPSDSTKREKILVEIIEKMICNLSKYDRLKFKLFTIYTKFNKMSLWCY